MRDQHRRRVLGVEIDALTMNETVRQINRYAKSGEFAHVIGINADKLLQLRDDRELKAIINRCEIVNADGVSMIVASKWLKAKLPERVAGIDLMYRLFASAEEEQRSVYLLGATGDVLDAAASQIRHDYPSLNISGRRNGYFRDDELSNIVSDIRNAAPTFIFVGISSPKKELLIESLREAGLAGVYLGVGGSFDVVAGKVKRAPKWVQMAKMEWMYRLLQEPRRLGKRYLVGNTRFLALLLKEKFFTANRSSL